MYFISTISGRLCETVDQCVLSWTGHIMKRSLYLIRPLISLSDEETWVTAMRLFPREPHLTVVVSVTTERTSNSSVFFYVFNLCPGNELPCWFVAKIYPRLGGVTQGIPHLDLRWGTPQSRCGMGYPLSAGWVPSHLDSG